MVTDLNLDDSKLLVSFMSSDGRDAIAASFQSTNHEDSDHHMLMHCRTLERLSIKNSMWFLNHNQYLPITEDMIIKFARRTPTLRRLRSDLTAENVTMLKQERPDVTFVME